MMVVGMMVRWEGGGWFGGVGVEGEAVSEMAPFAVDAHAFWTFGVEKGGGWVVPGLLQRLGLDLGSVGEDLLGHDWASERG